MLSGTTENNWYLVKLGTCKYTCVTMVCNVYRSFQGGSVVIHLHVLCLSLSCARRFVFESPRGKTKMWFPNRSDTNRPIQL